MPHVPALGDMMVTVDTLGNFKKDTIPSGGGGSATGVNGLTGTGNIGLGGALSGNTTETLGGHLLILNQGSTGNILQFNRLGTQVAVISNTGQYFGSGLSNNSTGNNSQISTATSGIFINRNIADSKTVVSIQNFHAGSTGDVVRMSGAAGGVWLGVGYNGLLNKSSYIFTSAGFGRGSLEMDVLQPTANNDLLVGKDIRPVFGTSIIAAFNTLVGGSGYGTASYNVSLTGGTGSGASAVLTASGGAITSVTSLNKGVNYTVGDVLSAVVTDAQGNVIGTGFSIRVSAITSYTGIQSVALRTYGRDIFDQDYSNTFTANDKVSKAYVDARTISGSYSLFASATTTFTVTIGSTQPNNTYKVQVTPTSVNAITGYYVTNKTTTTFDVVYPSGLNGSTMFDWTVLK